ncbi:MAG: hypothetical protein J5851_02805 [Oscillospiraceae bacterium]|nr:hypothetical protein [Oscillospiraceae bacterium]
MSFTLPGATMAYPGTQPIDMAALKSNIEEWSINQRLGSTAPPTYKSCNKAAAYFFFLKENMNAFFPEITKFLEDPDSPRFRDHRKIMILLSNILLQNYCDLKIGARQVDYETICMFDNTHKDLVNLVREWAKEIDKDNYDKLTEIYVVDGEKPYPIAFYSTQDFVVFPFNTINQVVLDRLIGWDKKKEEFTMEMLGKALDERPMTDRALYAALKVNGAGLNHPVIDALAQWLNNTRSNITHKGGQPYDATFNEIPVDNTTDMLKKLPIPKVPMIGDIMGNLFSEQLLIIKSNTNVKNGEYGLCQVPNISIGEMDPDAPQHAVVAPLSEELIGILHSPQGGTISFKGCNVLKEDGKYRVTITLEINGIDTEFTHVYLSNAVRKCDNFPLISILTKDKNTPTPVRLYRTDYNEDKAVQSVYLNGRDIKLGNKDKDARELSFEKQVGINQGQFYFASVFYHQNDGTDHYCGYLLFDQNGAQSLYSKAMDSSHTAVIIDEENNVAQIAKVDKTNMEDVQSYNVYNDSILFFNTNRRDDLDQAIKGRCWGELDSTIFALGDGRYALAPFKQEFAEMIADGTVSISKAPKPTLQINGEDWIFSVAFQFNGILLKTAPRVYHPAEQFTMANPPFFFLVDTVDKLTNVPGYEVIKVANMGITKSTSAINNGVDSNELTFKVDNKVIQSSVFTTPRPGAKAVFIHAYNGEKYLGQIMLDLAKYTQPEGFQALKDEHMSCAAIMLVRNNGMNKPKEIITGTVFDDNLFLIVKEKSREIYDEYKAWRKDGLVVEIDGITPEQAEGKEYQAVFPFSLKMLQNINNGSLQMLPDSTKVVYNQMDKCYEVSVSIMIPQATQNNACVPFIMKYDLSQGKVVKCDNLPFVIAVESKQQKGLARFNNDSSYVIREHLDGSKLDIEIVEDENKKLDDGGRIVPISSDQVVLRLSMQNGSSLASCHVLYQADQAIKDGVFSLQSEETGVQLVVDYDEKKQTVTKLDVFTDYVVYTIPMLTKNDQQVFAGGTQCTPAMPLGEANEPESRIYSIPVTMSFTELIERRYKEQRGDVRIAAYSNVKFQSQKADGSLFPYVVDDQYALHVEISIQGLNTRYGPAKISKVYPPEKVIEFVTYELPTLTVFPFVNFVADASFGAEMAGQPLWQRYNFAKFTIMSQTPKEANEVRNREALGSRVDFWVNGERILFKTRKSKLPQLNNEEKEMKVGTVNGWGRYIHMTYDGSGDDAPPQTIDTVLDKKEFGCIIMDLPEPVTVSANMTSHVGVDFGTRNSIIALKADGMMETIFPYHGSRELQQIIIPNMFHEVFDELSNYCYIPHFDSRPGIPGGAGCGKFASSIMVYDGVKDPNAQILPYDLGFIPNVQGSVLRKIMDGMGSTGSMGDALGFYTDLKVSTDGQNANMVRLMKRNVRTFIKSLMFHTVLNSYQAGCGDIDIRFSTPSDSYAYDLGMVWSEAREYIKDFIPTAAHGNIHVGDYATEAAALFEDLKSNMTGSIGGMPKFSAIADGGDGTYDFTINKYENNLLSTPPNGAFSLRYAGQQIMTDSVNAFYDHLVARNDGYHNEKVRTKFRDMWKVNQENIEATETLKEMVANLSSFREKHGSNRETEKTLALMLVEQFGIDYSKMISPNPKSLNDYVNPEYVNFVRMIQYKFLFLFNVLGEQIRKTVKLEMENETCFNVYLFGGTSQALLIAEPLCQGNLNVFSGNTEKLPMAMFIDAMLDLPRNVHGAKYGIKFLPAPDSEKREIARGLITMEPSALKRANNAGNNALPNLMMGGNEAANAAADPFSALGGGLAGFSIGNNAAAAGGSQKDALQPQTIEQFIDDLKSILNKRTVKLPQGEVCIDFFLTFLDEKNQPIKLSQILDDPYVRSQLSNSLTTMWNSVKGENPDIDDSKLLYHIYTLKMVGAAIEEYLRKSL